MAESMREVPQSDDQRFEELKLKDITTMEDDELQDLLEFLRNRAYALEAQLEASPEMEEIKTKKAETDAMMLNTEEEASERARSDGDKE